MQAISRCLSQSLRRTCLHFKTPDKLRCTRTSLQLPPAAFKQLRLSSSKPRLFVPSPEQQKVVELCTTHNVIVSARPGSGKTATAEAIVAAYPTLKVAVVTYSKRLQLDTALRLTEYPNAEVVTFHGLASQVFSKVVYNDTILREFRRHPPDITWSGQPYDIVVLDELQDCTEDLYWFVVRFLSLLTEAADGVPPRIVVLGDGRQAIYGFRGADARFLDLAEPIFSPLSLDPWMAVPLSKSFRLTHQTAKFVNGAFLRDDYIEGSRDGPLPIYLFGSTFDTDNLVSLILPLLDKYGAENAAILAPHVRKNRSLALLTNTLCKVHDIPIAVSAGDDIVLDDKVLFGKLSVATYHQFKGNEKNLVIVYGADASYFKHLARDEPDDRCPNGTFVAMTRARQQLVLVHDEKEAAMPFIDLDVLKKTCKFINFSARGREMTQKPPGRPLELGLVLPRKVLVADLARHVRHELLDDIVREHLEIEEIGHPLPESLHIPAPDKVLTDPGRQLYEAVSDLNGLAVTAAYEYELFRKLSTFHSKATICPPDTSLATWLCREACKYEAKYSGYESRMVQMKDHAFDWLDGHLETATERLRHELGDADKIKFEVDVKMKPFVMEDNGKDHATTVTGRLDIMTNNKGDRAPIIWEIKFLGGGLSYEHVMQLTTYAYLWTSQRPGRKFPRMMLYNVRDGAKWEIKARAGLKGVREVLERVMYGKYTKVCVKTDEQWVRRCAEVNEEAVVRAAEAGG